MWAFLHKTSYRLHKYQFDQTRTFFFLIAHISRTFPRRKAMSCTWRLGPQKDNGWAYFVPDDQMTEMGQPMNYRKLWIEIIQHRWLINMKDESQSRNHLNLRFIRFFMEYVTNEEKLWFYNSAVAVNCFNSIDLGSLANVKEFYQLLLQKFAFLLSKAFIHCPVWT